jgi:peptidoglycan hydrolase-like protein with peptidoglycan-binding domain
LYNHISVGTQVNIFGPINDLENNMVLAIGSRGTLVYLVQQRLKLAGYYSGEVNGIFNNEMEKAIKKYQQNHILTITGHGNQRLYLELGLLE